MPEIHKKACKLISRMIHCIRWTVSTAAAAAWCIVHGCPNAAPGESTMSSCFRSIDEHLHADDASLNWKFRRNPQARFSDLNQFKTSRSRFSKRFNLQFETFLGLKSDLSRSRGRWFLFIEPGKSSYCDKLAKSNKIFRLKCFWAKIFD